MRITLAVAALAALLAVPAFAAEAVKGEWTGYITDTHCGAKGATKEHTAGCVEKCMKGGSKAQIMNEADKAIYDLDSFDKVKTLVGSRVTVKGTLDSEKKLIAVDSAAKAETQ
ncbi:MAG TPA: hypothetical protein VII13_18715 [Vicinamibacteria bacterium]|jgi:hypothetical protein